ncbi:site-specific recombinase XerD [Galbibacter orientalis DSM 19592]|uniref:Site-specific recombinase XerD n=1 Tax=Galbibacter orientalis DSM 19592 TaxID=926559 RepID=I3C286_9FLAO|nr:tyrosine-type recombinase/integrase [Galbibacter orientalis]EIJ37729.1 site-specific recombinase XerD [Galbibacter orientalis DSM 19592]
MKPTDFSKYLSDFLTKYLIHERGASPNTIKSYRDTFVQFINYMTDERGTKLRKLTLSTITKELVVEFLYWLQNTKKCSAATRNNRLAAIHSFLNYVQFHHPDHLYEYQRILSVKAKKHKKESINYMSVDGLKLFLRQPNVASKKGRRDLALLSLIYDTGARVQELVDLAVQDINIQAPFTVRILGKGQKVRIVPLLQEQMEILLTYMVENDLMRNECRPYPLFFNHRNEKLTRGGVAYIVKKYAQSARKENPGLIPPKLSCHSLRHSKAMHLLKAGVNLVYIRDILGHVSIQTTEIYARVDSKQKQEAIQKAYVPVSPEVKPLWTKNDKLLEWLKSF